MSDLRWKGVEGPPGAFDLVAMPNKFVTYWVRHLDVDLFDVVLGGDWSAFVGLKFKTYEEAKRFAQEDWDIRSSNDG